MLTRIPTNSEALCTFVDGLGLKLSQPQRWHPVNLPDALLVCEAEKTPAVLQRQFLAAPDASKRLIKFARCQGWHVTCDLRSSRKLGSLNLRQHAQALRHQRYTRIAVTVADGPVTYCVRQVQGRLSGVPGTVRVFISKRQPRSQFLLYFACTDLSLSAQQALQGYHGRWSCEMDNFYLKTQLGLADFRVQSYEAVDKYLLVVHLSWAYVERRFSQERCAQIQCFGDIIRRHRDEHAVCWLTGALEAVLDTGDIQAVLQRFLRQPALAS